MGTNTPKFQKGDRVRKVRGAQWQGVIVGTYATALTPEGYAVESETEKGSVQIYPADALTLAPSEQPKEQLDRPYGPLYALTYAAKLLRAIDRNGGLCQGGEQYPNGLCCLDAASRLEAAEAEIRRHECPTTGWTVAPKVALVEQLDALHPLCNDYSPDEIEVLKATRAKLAEDYEAMIAAVSNEADTGGRAAEVGLRGEYERGFRDGWMRCGVFHVSIDFENEEQEREVKRRIAGLGTNGDAA